MWRVGIVENIENCYSIIRCSRSDMIHLQYLDIIETSESRSERKNHRYWVVIWGKTVVDPCYL